MHVITVIMDGTSNACDRRDQDVSNACDNCDHGTSNACDKLPPLTENL